jgi:hypothetical protein
MNTILNDHTSPLNHAVERLVSEHGIRAVLAALMLRLIRRRPQAEVPMIGRLTDHLRRDIGLPPVDVEHPRAPVPSLHPLL